MRHYPRHAFDRASSSGRSFDADGRLRVADCVISRGVVSSYQGREIPEFEKRGLDSWGVYQLLRDPDELEKAVDTFSHLPLLSEHQPVDARDHRPDLVIGALGEARFEDGDIVADLIVWDGSAIARINRGLRDLSCGYRYRPDMTPGEWRGTRYDGVMRDIAGNHVALVPDGRVPGAMIADARPVSFLVSPAFDAFAHEWSADLRREASFGEFVRQW